MLAGPYLAKATYSMIYNQVLSQQKPFDYKTFLLLEAERVFSESGRLHWG